MQFCEHGRDQDTARFYKNYMNIVARSQGSSRSKNIDNKICWVELSPQAWKHFLVGFRSSGFVVQEFISMA